jgi:hypothetical protein
MPILEIMIRIRGGAPDHRTTLEPGEDEMLRNHDRYANAYLYYQQTQP